MIPPSLYSIGSDPVSLPDAEAIKHHFGTKGSMLATIPRLWTPPFLLISYPILEESGSELVGHPEVGERGLSQITDLLSLTGKLIVRSSIIGESIWDRGSYQSVIIEAGTGSPPDELERAVSDVLRSAPDKKVALVIQSYITPVFKGEFGNLLRIAKTRDHWEWSEVGTSGIASRTRLNSQRDQAANESLPLKSQTARSRERLFGSVGAWINNELMHGHSERVNCEWVTDGDIYYLVQIDEEDEDLVGVNPYQIRIPPRHTPSAETGDFLSCATPGSLSDWDKLKVLEELWEAEAPYKPILFYIPFSKLPKADDVQGRVKLRDEFASLIGPQGIVIRTSTRAGKKKMNLPRTECIGPDEAANWCIEVSAKILSESSKPEDYAFVAHHFIAAKASAWAKADPNQPEVEIHALWGLPDALQYCPYDIWEVHLPTGTVTDYPVYKSDFLVSSDDGGWKHQRIKNELARFHCIEKKEVLEIATRTKAIADRMDKPCHVMWFVGCIDEDQKNFNVPWYWNDAHEAEPNTDRTNYQIITITDRESLKRFKDTNIPQPRLALELTPFNLNLMRDTGFITEVGQTALDAGVPVRLNGSTLAHAYYQLRAAGCAVVSTGFKDHSRTRKVTALGKLVRDKIPEKITQRQEFETSLKAPDSARKAFLISKVLEEALEVREAESDEEKTTELADLYEVFRALANIEGIALGDIIAAADKKKEKVGGFDVGLILQHTGLRRPGTTGKPNIDLSDIQVLSRKTAADTCEIPFTFFGFMDVDQPRAVFFEDLNIRLDVTLKGDRIVLTVSRGGEQLEFPLDDSIE